MASRSVNLPPTSTIIFRSNNQSSSSSSSFCQFLRYRRSTTRNSCFSLIRRSCFSISATASSSLQEQAAPAPPNQVRVRFAPSPTGNLHVGGARTALFNYLFARSKGGKFVLRIEDTDLERSTRASEEALLRDLSWLGLHWDEGPGVGGDYGPYRQSERNVMYRQYAEKLLKSGHVYRCFCSNEELEKMKEIAKLKELPPVYTGKWSNATDEEVEEELEKGTPYAFCSQVPKEGRLQIDDFIQGEVSWSLDTLGDFVIMRSNGQPVYNFCVTVHDATMAISHVIRAEEHLPNTLRQALIYKVILCGPNLSLMLSFFQLTNIFIPLEVAVTKPVSFGDLLVNYSKEPELSFVQRNGTHFTLDGRIFCINGWNSYYLMDHAVNEYTRPKVTAMLQARSKIGLTVCRTWAFNDGRYNSLQISPGQYDDHVFKVFARGVDADTVVLMATRASRVENKDAIDTTIVGTLADPKEARAGIQEVHFLPFNPTDKRTALAYIELPNN